MEKTTQLFIKLSHLRENTKDFTFNDAQNLMFACDELVQNYPTQVSLYLSASKDMNSLCMLIAGTNGNDQKFFYDDMKERFGVVIP